MNLASRRWIALLLVLLVLISGLPSTSHQATADAQAQPTPVTSHPRLLITVDDLPRLRGWATDANPLWRDSIALLAETLKGDMDSGNVPGGDDGTQYWQRYPTESYAEFFAFMSLIHPDPAARKNYAERARTLLMYVMNEAVKGTADQEPYRDPDFVSPTSDRLRWWGEGFALTVDWISPCSPLKTRPQSMLFQCDGPRR